MMKKFPLLLSLLGLLVASTPVLTSCNKEPDFITVSREAVDAQKKVDDEAIQAYLTRKTITNFRKLDSGIYLVPIVEGPATNPLIKAGQKVTVNYVGRFIGATNESQVFDASNTNRTECGCFSFINGSTGVIQGWSQATVEMRKGDRKLIIIPSYLAYGVNPSGSIPANTPLLFDLEILNVE